MLGHLDRQTAARYSAFAIVPIVLGVLGAGWALQGGGVNHQDRVDDQLKPREPVNPKPAPAAGVDPGTATAHPASDASSIAARFDAIKNHPVALVAETGPIDDLPPPPTPEPETDIKYVGPVHLGPSLLAILRVEGRQFTASKGRTISYTAAEQHHSAHVVDITDEEVTLDEGGTERKITRANAGGEVVSFLGGKPTRGGKPLAVKKKPDNKMGAADPRAAEEYQAKKARAMQELAPMLDKIRKSNPSIARELRDKAAATLKAQGLDPSAIDEAVGRSKTDKGGEK